MKILIVSDYGAPAGGAEYYTLNLITGLKNAGHAVRLLSGGRQVHGVACMADYCFPGHDQASRFAKITRGLYNALAVKALRQAIDDFKPDVVHVQMFLQQCSPSILGVLRGHPTFITIHEYRLFCPVGTKFITASEQICTYEPGSACVTHKCVNWAGLVAYAMQRAHVIRHLKYINRWLPPSSYAETSLNALGIKNISRLPYGFDPTKLPFIPPNRRKSTKQVLFLGRLDNAKGVKILVRAFADVVKQIPDARLLMAGQGTARNWIVAEINKRGLNSNVILLNWVQADKIIELHQGSAVLVAPSIWPDNLPLVICEAMFLGTPVVSTNIGGVPDLIENNVTGFLVPPNDAKSLSDAIIYLIKNRKRAEDFAQKARIRAEIMLNMDEHISKLNDIYCGK